MEALIGCLWILVPLLIALLWIGDRKYRIGVIWHGIPMRIRRRKEGPFPIQELEKDSLETTVCVDLGAFRWPLQTLPPWIKRVVLMGDRQWGPEFFLGQDHSLPTMKICGDYGGIKVSLNRHGPYNHYMTRENLAELVEELHDQGKEVLIGFWAFHSDPIRKPTPWLKAHPELRPREKDESDFGNLFVWLKKERMFLSEYIASQYIQTQRTYKFDGLFLGDGFCGFDCFFHPERYRDMGGGAEHQGFADFYRTIAKAVHQTGGQLWAYDCRGYSASEALLHGVDYLALSEAGLDVLVFQTYPTAWGDQFFRIPGKIGLVTDLEHFQTVQETLQGTKTQLVYTLEMGDKVEGWWPSHEATRWQMEVFSKATGLELPDKSVIPLKPADGKFLVWANDLISQL